VYLLQAYCFDAGTTFSVRRFLQLAASVVAVFVVSLGPFIWTGQGPALVARLFPFTRGLCHAYWAPNLWALYAGLDRCLILGKIDKHISSFYNERRLFVKTSCQKVSLGL
jgi:alpha-1,3-glucosyltransferase